MKTIYKKSCESFVEHLVGTLYFLQRTLFLTFSQISMSLAIYLYLRPVVLACGCWLFWLNILKIKICILALMFVKTQDRGLV